MLDIQMQEKQLKEEIIKEDENEYY